MTPMDVVEADRRVTMREAITKTDVRRIIEIAIGELALTKEEYGEEPTRMAIQASTEIMRRVDAL